jgi:hypothetical protein
VPQPVELSRLAGLPGTQGDPTSSAVTTGS